MSAQAPFVISHAQQQALRTTRWLLLLCVLAVTHGSLFPWQFSAPASLHAAWLGMWHPPRWWTGNGDVVGNVLLFAPLGALAWLALEASGLGLRRRLALITLSALCFAFALQVAQLWLPRRTPTISDVLWNGVGLALGLAVANALRSPLHWLATRRHAEARVAYVMGALWLAIAWWPLLPALRRTLLAHTWHHLFDAHGWQWTDLLGPAASLAIVLHLLRAQPWRAAAAIALPAVALAGKFVFDQQASVPGQAWAWLLGLALGMASWRVPERLAYRGVLLFAVGWFLVDGLRPFGLAETATPFHWMPLAAALQEQKVLHTLGLLLDFFWISVILIAVLELEGRLWPAAMGLATAALGLEFAQRWIPGQSADITVALLPVIAAWLLQSLWPPRAARLRH